MLKVSTKNLSNPVYAHKQGILLGLFRNREIFYEPSGRMG